MEIKDGDTERHWEIANQTKNVEELHARHERIEHLNRAICRLHPTLRNVVEIRQSNDLSVKEVADLAGISVAATSLVTRQKDVAQRFFFSTKADNLCRR